MTVDRCIIIPASAQANAQKLCAGLSPNGGQGMFIVGLSASGNAPATHYISAGPISSDMAALLPCKYVTVDAQGNQQITTTLGHPELVPALAAKAGITVTRAQIDALYASVDISDQEPFAAMARLGLKMVQVPL
jgi:hypothetical protein